MNRFTALATAFLCTASPGVAFTIPKSTRVSTSLNADSTYVGGFVESNSKYAYPQLYPDLSDIDIMDNMDNIGQLTRMQKVLWPQFSWLSIPGDESSRIYQMFAPDISRLGYDDKGQVFSIICPQQGFGTALIGELNIEVTVTGVRGWCEEDKHTVYADMGVKGRLWFSPWKETPAIVKALQKVMNMEGFPMSKEHSINITTHNPGQPWNPIFQLINGTDPSFPHPPYAQHWHEAYGVAYLNVEIGEIEKTGIEMVDDFNDMFVKIFNIYSGNIFTTGETLSWNVWFDKPEKVDQEEWKNHALVWRESLQVDHVYPTGEGYTNVHDEQTYFDGTEFKPIKSAIVQEAHLIKRFIKKWVKDRDALDEESQKALKFIDRFF